VRLVEEKGFEEVLSATDPRGLTVLHVAADAGHLDVLQHFVRPPPLFPSPSPPWLHRGNGCVRGESD
jgi:hypothetical protein